MKIIIEIPSREKQLLTNDEVAEIAKICMELEKILGTKIMNFTIEK